MTDHDALDHARYLAEHGVPLFICPPAETPDGGHNGCGYWIPKGWQNSPADPTVVDRWREGMALCAVMGHTVDGVDVDPRAGGEESAEQLTAGGFWPKSYGRQSTPSGGFHDLVAPLHVHSRDNVMPGLDVKAGDGGGHGFLFIAPTVKLSKATGELARYEWTEEPNFAELDDNDDSGSTLAARIDALRTEPTSPAATAPTQSDVTTAKLIAGGSNSWQFTGIQGVLQQLRDLQSVPVGEQPRWDTAVYAIACRLIELSNYDPNAYPRSKAESDFRTYAPTDSGFGPVQHEHKWNSAVSAVGDKTASPKDRPFAAALTGEQAPDRPTRLEVQVQGEYTRLKARQIAQERLQTERAAARPKVEPADGAEFVLDVPDVPNSIWGSGRDVLWADGEALMLAGPPGVGKTTLAGQIVRARLGIGDGKVLGYPVKPTSSRVLYLAMDRPSQIRRSLKRQFEPSDAETLRDRLVPLAGPPPEDLAVNTDLLVDLGLKYDADTIVVDSLKDAAVGLSDDTVGAGYNRARQKVLAAGIELLENHHLRKQGSGGGKPDSISDVYGSVWLTSGTGSVILLSGAPGDAIIELRHLRQPAFEVGPFQLLHDAEAGTMVIHESTDLVALAKAEGGITAKRAAEALADTVDIDSNQKEKARRRLNRLTRMGELFVVDQGDMQSNRPRRWAATDLHDPLHGTENGENIHEVHAPYTGGNETPGQNLHGDLHAPHGDPPTRRPPSLKEGGRVGRGEADSEFIPIERPDLDALFDLDQERR